MHLYNAVIDEAIRLVQTKQENFACVALKRAAAVSKLDVKHLSTQLLQKINFDSTLQTYLYHNRRLYFYGVWVFWRRIPPRESLTKIRVNLLKSLKE